ncbi:MAG: hypothetical protein M1825_006012 [Sarcosagium campestre]|nr:MAG: hypothetical protein M1825_006012 [Sarcosagium campestre]
MPPQILSSAYLLGSDSEHLNKVYDEEARSLEPWRDSPGEVSKHDWRDYLGDQRYQRAFIDFFEDELARGGYDWKQLAQEFLFEGEQPLINSVVSGLGHPLIHIGYAFEMNNCTIAIEALALTTCFYDFFHQYLDDTSYTRPAQHPTESIVSILERVRTDQRLDGLFDHSGPGNIALLFQRKEDIVLEHWNSWTIVNPKAQFEESQRAAVLLLLATVPPDSEGYDFFLVHLLTTSHAIRVLLPLIPEEFHVSLVRQWWLFTLAVYIAQLRPEIKESRITDYELAGRDWKWAEKQALASSHAYDAHYVKAIRAMKEAALTWGDLDAWYLRGAVRFADNFRGWFNSS